MQDESNRRQTRDHIFPMPNPQDVAGWEMEDRIGVFLA